MDIPTEFRTPDPRSIRPPHWLMLSATWLGIALLMLHGVARADTLRVCASGCEYSELGPAISAAAPGDTIEVGPGEYRGGIEISKPLTIIGDDAANVRISGRGTPRSTLVIRRIDPDAEAFAVRLERLTITEGNGTLVADGRYGGGLYIDGANVSIVDCTITGNQTGTDGGGVYNDSGNLTVEDSRIEGNRSLDGGGGLFNDSGGTLTMRNTTVRNNVARNLDDVDPEEQTFSNGGGIVTRDEALIEDSRIENNTTPQWGGGIYAFGASDLTLRNTEIISNSALEGGALYSSSEFVIEGGRFERNRAESGGGVFTIGEAEITDATIADNSATRGGGIVVQEGFAPSNVGELLMRGVTLSGNSADEAGGALFGGDAAEVEIILSTLSGNTALDGGAVHTEGADMVELTESTVANNEARTGAGLSASRPNVIRLGGTLLSNPDGDDCAGSIRSNGHNLDTDGSCAFTRSNDISLGFSGLEPLADNGGPTLTHGLQRNSDAIDAGHPNRCEDEDQRGRPRPVDFDGDGEATCDIGSFELQLESTATSTVPASATPTPTAGTGTGTPGTPSTIQATIYLPAAHNGTGQ